MSGSHSALGNKSLGNINVLNLFFYLMLMVCVAFQTWGYSFGDRVYIGAVAAMGILVVAKVLSSHYTGRDLVICIVLLGMGLFFAARAHRYTVLLTAVLLIGAKDIDSKRLLNSYLWIKTVSFVAFFLLAAAGIFEVSTTQHYRMITGDWETRTLINGAATNIVHLGYFTIAVLLLYRNYGHIRLMEVTALLAGDALLYFLLTRSTAGVSLTALSVVLMYLCSKFRRIENGVIKLAPFVPFILMTVMVVLGYGYGTSEIIERINRFSTGRIAYDHYWLTAYGPSLFGADYAQLATEGNFDDSFVYVIVVYGIVFAGLLYGSITALLVKMRKSASTSGILLVVLFLIYSAAESMYPSAVVNPSLFLLCNLLFDEEPRNKGLGERCISSHLQYKLLRSWHNNQIHLQAARILIGCFAMLRRVASSISYSVMIDTLQPVIRSCVAYVDSKPRIKRDKCCRTLKRKVCIDGGN